ncbi:histone-lysine N-methyltransferase SETMAR-like [Hydra vulgaris]|uniref:Histone-lysine N-methyltransferase SETMAR-like n=1 Tax=Hydra vulgaris TaxID=6087 RepID=A0ABM4BUD9_HYDVU
MQIDKVGIRLLIETCRRNQKSPPDAHKFITSAWGEDATSIQTVYKYYQRLIGDLRISFDGKAYVEVLPNGQSVNSEVYMLFLSNMHSNFVNRGLKNVTWNTMLLQDDNVRPHVSAAVKDFLAEKKVTSIIQPPYSPDFNLLDRHAFSSFEFYRKDLDFQTKEEVQEAMETNLRSHSHDHMQRQLEKLKTDLNEIILKQGAYL